VWLSSCSAMGLRHCGDCRPAVTTLDYKPSYVIIQKVIGGYMGAQKNVFRLFNKSMYLMKCLVKSGKSRVLSKEGISDVAGQRRLSHARSWPSREASVVSQGSSSLRCTQCGNGICSQSRVSQVESRALSVRYRMSRGIRLGLANLVVSLRGRITCRWRLSLRIRRRRSSE